MAADFPAQSALRPAVGLLGGRFDPVHRAHQAMARICADHLNLSEVRWIVSGAPPHKSAVAAAHHRFKMVQHAVADMHDSRMKADDWEIRAAYQHKTTYTADTLQHFLGTHEKTQFVWIMGQDQFSQLTTWSRWAWLVKHMEFAVFGRSSNHSGQKQLNDTSAGLMTKAIVHIMPPLDDPISSTSIRERLAHHQSINGLTPPAVVDYISANHLYK